MEKSSSSTLSSSWMTELLTLSLWERSATLQGKLILPASIRDHVLLVMIQSS